MTPVSSPHSSWCSSPSLDCAPRGPLIWRRVDFDQDGRMITSDDDGRPLEVYNFEREDNYVYEDPVTLLPSPSTRSMVVFAGMSFTRRAGPFRVTALSREATACELVRDIEQYTSSTIKDVPGSEDRVKTLLNKVSELLNATASDTGTEESLTEAPAEGVMESPPEVPEASYDLPFNFASSLTLYPSED